MLPECDDGGLHLCAKTSRKTWESWLVFYYPERAGLVYQSQGHTGTTSLVYYQNMPFTDADKAQMKAYVEGWV